MTEGFDCGPQAQHPCKVLDLFKQGSLSRQQCIEELSQFLTLAGEANAANILLSVAQDVTELEQENKSVISPNKKSVFDCDSVKFVRTGGRLDPVSRVLIFVLLI